MAVALKDMPLRVLVTGAGGFVGRHLIASLDEVLPPGSEIVAGSATGTDATRKDGALGIKGSAPARIPLRVVEMDITDAKQVSGVIKAERPTHIVHLAAVAAVTAATRDPRLSWNVNLNGTLNIALAVADECPECGIVFSGSSEVYGLSFKDGVPLDESAALQPVNPYASSKAAADLMLGQMALQGLKVARLRPFNHTGPGQTEHFAIPSFAAQIARIERGLQEPVIRVGSLDSLRDFLDVQDVVDAYVSTVFLADELPAGCVMNLASGKPRRIGDMLDTMLAMSDVRIEVTPDPTRFRPSDTPLVVGDSSRARALLNWRPKREMDYTLASVLDYWRAYIAG
jgi:GDP-4-dehydro-6-deoxy-D-mannose reductase